MAYSFIRRLGSLATNIALALLSTGLVVLVAEVGFRTLFQEQRTIDPIRDRPRMLYLPENYNVEFHDHRYNKEKAENTFRIAVVGDSFTKGGKVAFDDSFAKRLERALNRNQSQP